jgi:hypothetical protein
MKTELINKPMISLRLFFGLIVLIVLTASSAMAQNFQRAKIQINLDKLADKAEEVVDVTLEEQMLQLAAKFLNANDPDEAAAKQLISGLKSVNVRVYEFAKEGDYSPSDMEGIRTQLRAPGWTRMMGIISKRDRENVEVYLMSEGPQILGLAVIAADPKELTVVNIVGPIDVDKLSRLEGKFGIPKIGVRRSKSGKSSDE